MLKLFSWLLKVAPSVYYIVELNIFLYNWFMSIGWVWLRVILIVSVPSITLLSIILYFTTFRDILERQLSKEQDENESRNFTVEIQTKRMIRKYSLYIIVGVVSAILYLYYKSNIFTMILSLVVIFLCFLLGEMFRIISIGRANNKKIKKEEPQ